MYNVMAESAKVNYLPRCSRYLCLLHPVIFLKVDYVIVECMLLGRVAKTVPVEYNFARVG